MKFFYVVFFFFLSVYSGFGQEISEDINSRKIKKYILLKDVQEKNIALTKEDSLAFLYRNDDTLVLVTPAIRPHFPEGIRVRVHPQDSMFIEKYKAVVFGPKTRRDRKDQSLKIWKNGIQLYFDPSVPKNHQKELLRFARNLSSGIDSLDIKKVRKREDANYMVFYRNSENDFDLDPRIKDSKSGYYLNWTKNRYITRSSLKVNSYAYENRDEVLSDLKKRFFETLGYFRNSNRLSCGSLLSGCNETKDLSEEDLEIVKYHYSYQNCYGIDLEDFECQHERRRKKFAKKETVAIFVYHALE